MARLSGVLKAPTGQLMKNAYMVLVSKANTSVMLKGLQGEYMTDASGNYSFECPIGVYDVYVRSYESEMVYSGSITISNNDPDGPINNYLSRLDPSDITPDIVAQVIQYSNRAAQAATEASQAAEQVTAVTELANQAATAANNAADKADAATAAATLATQKATAAGNSAAGAGNSATDAAASAAAASQSAGVATSQATQAKEAATNAKQYQVGTIYKKQVIDVTAAQTTVLLDLTVANYFILNLANVNELAITITGALTDTDKAIELTVKLVQSTGANKVKFPASVKWQNNVKPVWSWDVNKKDFVTLFSDDAGATWSGFFSGQGFN